MREKAFVVYLGAVMTGVSFYKKRINRLTEISSLGSLIVSRYDRFAFLWGVGYADGNLVPGAGVLLRTRWHCIFSANL